MDVGEVGVLAAADLTVLIDALRADGRRVLGPIARDGVIGYGDVTSAADLPRGLGDAQEPGHYRTVARGDGAYFGFASTATTWKSVLFPARALLWRGTREGSGFSVQPPANDPVPLALLGVRGCDLAAIGVHDRVLRDRLDGRPAADPQYAAAREDVLIVAVACGSPASTCFCSAAGTGPRPGAGADLLLTEILDGGHRFLVEAVTPAGRRIAETLPLVAADPADTEAADTVVATAVDLMSRRLPAGDVREALLSRAEHPQWDDVARRCLACANCTMSCPTCFCTTVEDVTDLTGQSAQRWRVWDSCFTPGFSYLHGGSVRATTRARYRHWLTHKFGTWVDQFGTSGCVGCGRCIAWCPAAIDVTAELSAVTEA